MTEKVVLIAEKVVLIAEKVPSITEQDTSISRMGSKSSEVIFDFLQRKYRDTATNLV
jgi:hypothetical protein